MLSAKKVSCSHDTSIITKKYLLQRLKSEMNMLFISNLQLGDPGHVSLELDTIRPLEDFPASSGTAALCPPSTSLYAYGDTS